MSSMLKVRLVNFLLVSGQDYYHSKVIEGRAANASGARFLCW